MTQTNKHGSFFLFVLLTDALWYQCNFPRQSFAVGGVLGNYAYLHTPNYGMQVDNFVSLFQSVKGLFNVSLISAFICILLRLQQTPACFRVPIFLT